MRMRRGCCAVDFVAKGIQGCIQGWLCAGDTLEVRTYERLLPLVPQPAAITSLKTVRRGDCLVAFSRRDVHGIKRAIDSHGALKCCMVYGALPAEARTQQVFICGLLRLVLSCLVSSAACSFCLSVSGAAEPLTCPETPQSSKSASHNVCCPPFQCIMHHNIIRHKH